MNKQQMTIQQKNEAYKRKITIRNTAIVFGCAALLVISFIISMNTGYTKLTPMDTLRTLFGGGTAKEILILFDFRLPPHRHFHAGREWVGTFRVHYPRYIQKRPGRPRFAGYQRWGRAYGHLICDVLRGTVLPFGVYSALPCSGRRGSDGQSYLCAGI